MRRAFGWADYETGTTPLAKPPKRGPVTAGTDQQGDLLAPVVPAARNTDPPTSNAAIHGLLPRAGSQQHRLLLAYGSRPMGLIAEEAGEIAGLNVAGCCYWKRIGELLHEGFLEDTHCTLDASTGSMQRVLAITDKGKRAIK